MIAPKIINVICPRCTLTWMNFSSIEYFCVCCGFTLTEEQAKYEAWRSKSIYYGE
jgi:hypothetical protein